MQEAVIFGGGEPTSTSVGEGMCWSYPFPAKASHPFTVGVYGIGMRYARYIGNKPASYETHAYTQSQGHVPSA